MTNVHSKVIKLKTIMSRQAEEKVLLFLFVLNLKTFADLLNYQQKEPTVHNIYTSPKY